MDIPPLHARKDYWTGSLHVVAGVFLGSAAWWLTLSAGVGLLRERVTDSAMTWINRFSGLVILAFGLAALLSAFGEVR